METDGKKLDKNIYFECRKKAAICNKNLQSRERAAELIGISASTLADYELGQTKRVPAENVAIMAEVYHSPELRSMYCKSCPLGKDEPLVTEVVNVERVALKLLKNFDAEVIKGIEKDLIDIASDGVIDDNEKPVLEVIVSKLDEIALAINELKLISNKLKG